MQLIVRQMATLRAHTHRSEVGHQCKRIDIRIRMRMVAKGFYLRRYGVASVVFLFITAVARLQQVNKVSFIFDRDANVNKPAC